LGREGIGGENGEGEEAGGGEETMEGSRRESSAVVADCAKLVTSLDSDLLLVVLWIKKI
jgi:hypothetical protein